MDDVVIIMNYRIIIMRYYVMEYRSEVMGNGNGNREKGHKNTLEHVKEKSK